MEAYVLDSPVGIFALDSNGAVVQRAFFEEKAAVAAEKLRRLQAGEAIPEIADLCAKLRQTGFTEVILEHEKLAKSLEGIDGLKTRVERGSKIVQEFRQKLSDDWKERSKWLKQQMLEVDLIRDLGKYQRFARDVTLELAKKAVAVAAARRDLYAVQAVRAIDDVDKTLNLFAGRIREWYGLHFPELDRLVDKHDTYIRLVANLGRRENFTPESLEKEGLPREKAREIGEAAKRSMGAQIAEEDLEWLRSLCNDTLELYRYRSRAETYVDEVMRQVAPNMAALLGSVLSARLMSIAGGLENMAKMPASTLQVLGAEKALFRSLKTGARPPKHGVIFQYASIHQAPRWQRGKIARAISGKLAIAARIDAYGGEYAGDSLARDIEKRIADIKEKYERPPVRKGDERRRG